MTIPSTDTPFFSQNDFSTIFGTKLPGLQAPGDFKPRIIYQFPDDELHVQSEDFFNQINCLQEELELLLSCLKSKGNETLHVKIAVPRDLSILSMRDLAWALSIGVSFQSHVEVTQDSLVIVFDTDVKSQAYRQYCNR